MKSEGLQKMAIDILSSDEKPTTGRRGGGGERTKKWVHIENMYPLLTLRLLFVHHLRLSDVAVSRKKSLSVPYPHCFVSLRNRRLLVRHQWGVFSSSEWMTAFRLRSSSVESRGAFSCPPTNAGESGSGANFPRTSLAADWADRIAP